MVRELTRDYERALPHFVPRDLPRVAQADVTLYVLLFFKQVATKEVAVSVQRCVAVIQRKGGVGKTSTVTNVAGWAAASGLRVLVVDFDPQGNARRDFGYPQDSGEAFLNALITSAPLPVMRNIRERLDVIPGGMATGDLAGIFLGRQFRSDAEGLDSVFEAKLSEIADDYDLILIDTPPGDRIIVEAVLNTAVAVIIPTQTDEASIDGLEGVAKMFITGRQRNPDLRLAGVLLFAVATRVQRNGQGDGQPLRLVSRIERDVRASIGGMLGDAAPVFKTVIRDHKSAAVDARKRGLLVHELKEAAKADRAGRLEALRAGEKPSDGLYSEDPSLLAANYKDLSEEIFKRIVELENERATEGVSA